MKTLELTTKQAVEYLKENVKIHDNIELACLDGTPNCSNDLSNKDQSRVNHYNKEDLVETSSPRYNKIGVCFNDMGNMGHSEKVRCNEDQTDKTTSSRFNEISGRSNDHEAEKHEAGLKENKKL